MNALQGAAYLNDNQVRRVTIERFDTDKQNPRLEVRVSPYLQAA